MSIAATIRFTHPDHRETLHLAGVWLKRIGTFQGTSAADRIERRPANNKTIRPQMRSGKSQAERIIEEDWKDFSQSLTRKVENAKASQKLLEGKTLTNSKNKIPPCQTPLSIIKRDTYIFVNRLSSEDKMRWLYDVLTDLPDSKKPLKVDYRENPYYCVLSRICRLEGFKKHLVRSEVGRFAQQLLYASRNKVPEHFLIGFLYQIGGSRVVKEYLDDPDHYEDWFPKPQVALD